MSREREREIDELFLRDVRGVVVLLTHAEELGDPVLARDGGSYTIFYTGYSHTVLIGVNIIYWDGSFQNTSRAWISSSEKSDSRSARHSSVSNAVFPSAW